MGLYRYYGSVVVSYTETGAEDRLMGILVLGSVAFPIHSDCLDISYYIRPA